MATANARPSASSGYHVRRENNKRSGIKANCKSARQLPLELVDRIALEACSLPPKWDPEGDANSRKQWLRNRYARCMGWIRVSNRYRVLVTPLLFEHIWLRNVVTAEAMRSFWSQTRQPVDARCRNPEATLRRDCVLGLHLDLGPPETRFDFVHILPNLEVLHWPDGWDPLRSSILGAPKNSSGVHFSKLRYIANINAASVEAEGYSVEEAFPADLARIIARCPNLETLSFADPELEWLALERRVIIDAIRVHTMTASFFRHDIEPGSSGGGLTRLEFVKRCRLPDRGLLEGIGAAAPNLRELVLDVGADAIGWDLTNLMAAFPKLEKLSLQSLCAARGVTGNLDLVLQNCPHLRSLDLCASLLTSHFFFRLVNSSSPLSLTDLRLVAHHSSSHELVLHPRSAEQIMRMAKIVTVMAAEGTVWASLPLLIRLELLLDLC